MIMIDYEWIVKGIYQEHRTNLHLFQPFIICFFSSLFFISLLIEPLVLVDETKQATRRRHVQLRQLVMRLFQRFLPFYRWDDRKNKIQQSEYHTLQRLVFPCSFSVGREQFAGVAALKVRSNVSIWQLLTWCKNSPLSFVGISKDKSLQSLSGLILL